MPEPGIHSLGWLGVRTERFAAMAACCADALGLECLSRAPDDAWNHVRAPDGHVSEIIGPV